MNLAMCTNEFHQSINLQEIWRVESGFWGVWDQDTSVWNQDTKVCGIRIQKCVESGYFGVWNQDTKTRKSPFESTRNAKRILVLILLQIYNNKKVERMDTSSVGESAVVVFNTSS
jgi:Tfp pilus tip-associated adhesin PilY1